MAERLLVIIPLALWRDVELSDSAKLVAGDIGTFMRRDGTCAPGHATIAAVRGISIATVERAIAELRQRKHLTTQRHQRGPSTLQWLHPLTPQADEGSREFPTPHKSGLDPSKSAYVRGLDPSRHVTRARTERGIFNEVNEGKAAQNERGHSDRPARYHVDASERPAHDLDSRDRPPTPVSIRGQLTKFLTPPDPEPLTPVAPASTV